MVLERNTIMWPWASYLHCNIFTLTRVIITHRVVSGIKIDGKHTVPSSGLEFKNICLFSFSLDRSIFMKWKELTSKFKVSSYLALLLTNKVAGLLFSPVPTLWSFYWFYTPFVMRMSLGKYPQQEVCSQSKGKFVWLEERLFCTGFLHILQNSLLIKPQNNCVSLFVSYIRATYLHEIKEENWFGEWEDLILLSVQQFYFWYHVESIIL